MIGIKKLNKKVNKINQKFLILKEKIEKTKIKQKIIKMLTSITQIIKIIKIIVLRKKIKKKKIVSL